MSNDFGQKYNNWKHSTLYDSCLTLQQIISPGAYLIYDPQIQSIFFSDYYRHDAIFFV